MKKTGKHKSIVTLKGIDELLNKISEIKEAYLNMTNIEDNLIESFDHRLDEI